MISVETRIHPTAIVSPHARIADDVTIGAFSLIEDDVEIGSGTHVMSHVVIANGARIGCDVRIHPGAVISTAPQDLKYKGEPTNAFVGDRTVVRECVTINRGTSYSKQARVGSDCLLMSYSHVAHDCVVGNHVILANSVQLGGHVEIGDWAIIGGLTGIHQFCRIGAHCMIAAAVMIVKDVSPFVLAGRNPLNVEGLNAVGLRRRGFDAVTIAAIDEFYDILLRSGFNVTTGLRHYESTHDTIIPEVQQCIEFIRSSKRGITL
ncbi:acyl-ACP--UDP-N-acetylglucosamine O-acyltransferase [soil metagenome]